MSQNKYSYRHLLKYIVLFLLFSTSLLFSQNNKIHVLDAETKEEIQNADIIIRDLEHQKNRYYRTDSNGELLTTINHKSFIQVGYTGYISQTDTIFPNESKDYYLLPDVFLLDQVVITATNSRKKLKNSPILTQVITGKQIQERGLVNIQDVLTTDIPNIEFNKVGFGTNINAQGLEAKNILILVDGERLSGEVGSNIDYSRLNTQDIERIEIIKGAASTLYGSQAMGVVVNIITKKTHKKLFATSSMQYITAYNTNYPELPKTSSYYSIKKNLDKPNLTYAHLFGFTQGKWTLKTGFVQKSSDAYQLFDTDSLKKKYIEKDILIYEKSSLPTNINGFSDYTINQSLIYTPTKKIAFAVKGSYYQHEEQDFVFDNIHDKFRDLNYNAKVKITPNERLKYIISYNNDTYQKYDHLEILNKDKENYQHHISNPKIATEYRIHEKHNLSIGVDYSYESLLSKFFDEDQLKTKSIYNTSFYIQDDIKVSDAINIIGGVRSEYHKSYGIHTTPKASIMYKNHPFTLRLNYASGYRSPSLKELYMDWNLLGMFTIKGNQNLRPETNQYYSASIEYSRAKINTSINVYKNNFKDKIEGLWQDNQTVYKYYNTTKTQLTGVDIAMSYLPIQNVKLKLNYAYIYENRDEGIRISSISPHTANFSFEYSYKRKKHYSLISNLEVKYIGSKDYLVEEEVNIGSQQETLHYQVHYNPYSIWRFSINQSYKDYGNIRFGVQNLLNYKAPIVSFDSYSDPGRNYFFGIELNIESIIN